MLPHIQLYVLTVAGMYGFAVAYLAAPVFGWHLDSASIAESFGAMNEYSKFAIKGAVALPFTFHSWNGIRHLMWDTATELDLKGGRISNVRIDRSH